jgi:hypothetical protein
LARAPTLVSGISLDRLTGQGPAEKAGRRIDKAVDALKK